MTQCDTPKGLKGLLLGDLWVWVILRQFVQPFPMNVGDHEVRSDALKQLEVSMTGKDESKRKPREDQEKGM